LEPGEKAAGAWITTRLETARLDSAWISERPILQSMVKALNERAGELEEKRDLIKATTAKDREEIDVMKAKNKAAADDLHIAETRLQALVAQLMELRASLPPRLSEALELPYRSLGNPALASGERMQLVMTLLDRCAVFNRTVTCGEEVLSIDGEQGARSLGVIYWGLSHGYALDRASSKAWYGSPGPHGWQWEARPDAVSSVTRLIAIYNDRADPEVANDPRSAPSPSRARVAPSALLVCPLCRDLRRCDEARRHRLRRAVEAGLSRTRRYAQAHRGREGPAPAGDAFGRGSHCDG
jgi:hypothetical protein